MTHETATTTSEVKEEMAMNQYQKALQSHFVAQWITSLAISVICCAVLFVVFAGYIMQLHEKTNLTDVRLSVLQERQIQIQDDFNALKRAPMVQINSNGVPQVSTTEPQPSANGVEIPGQAPSELGKVDAGAASMTPPEPNMPAPAVMTPPKPDMAPKPAQEPLPIVR